MIREKEKRKKFSPKKEKRAGQGEENLRVRFLPPPPPA